MILSNSLERTRFLRFALVGVIGAVVDFGMLNILVNIFSLPVVLSGIISFLSAVTSNFIWNRYWTYPDSRSKTVARQFLEFTIINAMGLLIRVPILAFLDPVLRAGFSFVALPIPLMTPNQLGDNVTLAIAILIVMFWNFFANRFWTYADVSSA